jgi:oligopeptide/dipeptide ABC transporter ATP-binding protein
MRSSGGLLEPTNAVGDRRGHSRRLKARGRPFPIWLSPNRTIVSPQAPRSTAMSSLGSQDKAMAMATRWRMPPENWCGCCLDPGTVQAQILDLLAREQRRRRMAMILINHDLGVVAGRTDEVAVMYAGRVVERAPTPILFKAMRMPYTQALIAAIPRLDAPPHTPLKAISGLPPDLTPPSQGCAFAPALCLRQWALPPEPAAAFRRRRRTATVSIRSGSRRRWRRNGACKRQHRNRWRTPAARRGFGGGLSAGRQGRARRVGVSFALGAAS